MNNFRKYNIIFIILILLINTLCPVTAAARTKNKNTGKQEEEMISQIESCYNQGKKSLAEGKFLAAIVKFNHVIELEKDFYVVYTPYAKEHIQRTQEKIREKETAKLPIEKKPEKKRITTSNEAESPDNEVESIDKTYEYTISESDTLYISIWQEENLSHEVIVRPDGKISFPLAGDIRAAGLTFAQLKEELTERLKDYIKYPIVSVVLIKLGGKKIIVLGEVGNPGVYSVTGKKTVLEAIALVGGFTPDAVPSSTILIRGGFQHPKGTKLNLTHAISKNDYSQNVALQPEDIVYVPKKFIANVNYALTQILGPIVQGASTVSSVQGLDN